MAQKLVYHTTRKGNADRIAQKGYRIDSQTHHLYGRGVYFWERRDDAENYGKTIFGENNYEIMQQRIEVNRKNSITYDHSQAYGSPDDIAQRLLNRGIEVIIIPTPLIEGSTLGTAKGKAYSCLIKL